VVNATDTLLKFTEPFVNYFWFPQLQAAVFDDADVCEY
jgi:hypothetical protein